MYKSSTCATDKQQGDYVLSCAGKLPVNTSQTLSEFKHTEHFLSLLTNLTFIDFW